MPKVQIQGLIGTDSRRTVWLDKAIGSGRDEIVLKQNTKYQLSLYGTDADPATLMMDWYEHTDKD